MTCLLLDKELLRLFVGDSVGNVFIFGIESSEKVEPLHNMEPPLNKKEAVNCIFIPKNKKRTMTIK